MECFNNLLLKLREVHEREVEGWQMKIQELSNKKGCDTKRMEELFAKNHQMKEQQRILTENIKTLENRLRAGLCDRCTVTQEVAKRRQQEFEASQIQSLQHISLLAGEMNNQKKENKRLRDEIRNLRAALKGHSNHSSKSNTTTEVKPNSSPDLSPSSGPVALVTTATNRASKQPADGDVPVKTEADQRTEAEAEHRQLRGMNRSHFESYKPLSLSTLALPSWKTEHSVARVGERRVQSVEGPDQRSSIPPQEVNSSRHVLHSPVPCRPQPIKSSPVTLPWPLSESSDWVTAAAAGTRLVVQPNLPRFPNLVPTSQHASPRRQVFGSSWHKQSTPQPPAKEPTVLFRLRSLSEHVESQTKPQEKKENPPPNAERVSGEGLREAYEGPLDLSDRGTSKSSQTPRDDSPLALQGGERVQKSPDKDMKTNPPAHGPVSSPSPVVPLSSSSTQQQEGEPPSDHNHKQVIKEQQQKEEVNGETNQNNDKKVPVLTISLRPVVLETLHSALQKQETLSSNGKSSSPAVEPQSSSDEQDEEESASRQESDHGCKRKRASVETETDRDSDIDNIQRERKNKIKVKTDKKCPS
ncbi:DNA endonuclease RBBP8 isoform X5 [Siniperca chuatsi]|uniref:DNA endonuclease RBBP8 isoform X5 n=1 Tax=Siniperca chuatsi TaxID=119488 RepID=UPI001CE0A976|nr:DNA endonuclease RBBP8 isoform X5 [Siniperca chuatsi]